jgi:hypothetical protein
VFIVHPNGARFALSQIGSWLRHPKGLLKDIASAQGGYIASSRGERNGNGDLYGVFEDGILQQI